MPDLPPQPPSRLREPLLVGREREQAILREALDAMLGGHGSLMLVSGGAGIGKTTLVEWLAREAEAEGCLVLKGGCYDLTTTPPYGPWRELRGSHPTSGDRPRMPSFDVEPDAADALASQHDLIDPTWATLAVIADQQPLMIVLEDLHWSDAASLDLLRAIVRRVRGERVLLVATYRSDELTRHHPLYQLLPALIRETNARRLDVQRLSPDATATLIATRYALNPSNLARLVDWLTARAEGNPFFLEEMLHELENQQLHQEQSGSWTLDDLHPVTLPPMLRQVIDTRLAHLGETTVGLLGIGAVIGQQVPLDLWATVSEASDDELATTIEVARAASIVIELPDGLGWQFRHALIREALYEEIVSVRRRNWHLRVAETLAAGSRPDPDVVAHHFRQANDDRAVDWLIRAGERAAALYASRTAIERLEAALPALEESGDERRRGWVLWLLGEQLEVIDSVRASAYLGEAERIGSTIGDNLLVAHTRISRGNARTRGPGLADVTSGVDLLDQLLGHSVEPPPIYVRDWSHTDVYHASRALMRAMVGDLSGTLDDISEYVSVATDQDGDRRADDHSTVRIAITQQVSIAYNALGRVRAMQGQTVEASQAFETCADLMARMNDIGDSYAVTFKDWLAYLALPYFADDLELRRALFERHDRAWAQTAENFGAGPMPEGVNHLLTSYLDGAWSEMDWMVDWWHERMAAYAEPWAVGEEVVFARRAHARGDFERAWREIRRVLTQGPATEPGDSIFRIAVELLHLAIELALEAGNLSDAHDWLQAHDRWLAWSGAFTGRADGDALWARYHAARGDRLAARQLAEQALALASNPRQPLALMAIHRFLGQLETADQKFADADRHLAESLRLAEACAAPFERALTLLELAELRALKGRPDEATALLDEVQATCEPLKAQPTLARAEALRRRLNQSRRKTPSLPAGLSQREADVLRLVAEGLTDAEIANKFFLSRRTVSAHLRSVYSKIGMGSRAAAAVWAKEQGVI